MRDKHIKALRGRKLPRSDDIPIIRIHPASHRSVPIGVILAIENSLPGRKSYLKLPILERGKLTPFRTASPHVVPNSRRLLYDD